MIGLLERYGLQQRARDGDREDQGGDGGAAAAHLPAAAAGDGGARAHLDRRPPADGPAAGRADGDGGGGGAQWRPLDEETEEKVKAYSAATDNVGLFFGEDIFIAIGSIILIQSTLATYGYELAPLELAMWAIPTAIAAFLIHGTRLLLFDRTIAEAQAMIRMEHLYILTGAVFAGWALLSLFDRSNRKRFGNAAFWGLHGDEPDRRLPLHRLSPTA